MRCLLELERPEAALSLAERARNLCQHETPPNNIYAELVYGMALTATDPHRALHILLPVIEYYRRPLVAHRLARASLYAAQAYLRLDQHQKARSVLSRAVVSFAELAETGWQLMAGPATTFAGMRQLFDAKRPQLVLNVLGTYSASLHAEPLVLTPREQELLFLLALHPNGLSLYHLLMLIFDRESKRRSLVTSLSALRNKVPISQEPYRLMVTVEADFLELQSHLARGQVAAAVECYQGELLVASSAPGIVDLRERLTGMLRAAILNSSDVDAILTFANKLDDDLELWEHALNLLATDDPRRTAIEAKVAYIKQEWDI
ncbi:MAG: helix-turn-helix domain-containing protein [Deinococcota bacterium]